MAPRPRAESPRKRRRFRKGGSEEADVRRQESGFIGASGLSQLLQRRQQEWIGTLDHSSQHFANFRTQSGQLSKFRGRDVPAVATEIDTGIRFAIFAVAVCQLAEEMSGVTPFGPGLPEILTNRSGSSSDLPGQSERLFPWKTFADFKHPHRERVALFINR